MASHPVPLLPAQVQVEPPLQAQADPVQEHSLPGQSDLDELPQAARAAMARERTRRRMLPPSRFIRRRKERLR